MVLLSTISPLILFCFDCSAHQPRISLASPLFASSRRRKISDKGKLEYVKYPGIQFKVLVKTPHKELLVSRNPCPDTCKTLQQTFPFYSSRHHHAPCTHHAPRPALALINKLQYELMLFIFLRHIYHAFVSHSYNLDF